MEAEKDRVVHTVTFGQPTGTTAGTKTVNISLPTGFSKVCGFYVERTSGNDYHEIEIKDGNGMERLKQCPMNFITYSNNGAVPIDQRMYRRAPFVTPGEKVLLTYNWTNTLVADNTFRLIMELERV